MQPNQIQEKIIASLPGAHVTVSSPDNIHYSAIVTYHGFIGKNVLAQHRMVYQALDGLLEAETIHALELTTKTPED
jgi:Predicted transcriptional regulator, BolA superfamily